MYILSPLGTTNTPFVHPRGSIWATLSEPPVIQTHQDNEMCTPSGRGKEC
jgi:hypothetical protein